MKTNILLALLFVGCGIDANSFSGKYKGHTIINVVSSTSASTTNTVESSVEIATVTGDQVSVKSGVCMNAGTIKDSKLILKTGTCDASSGGCTLIMTFSDQTTGELDGDKLTIKYIGTYTGRCGNQTDTGTVTNTFGGERQYDSPQ